MTGATIASDAVTYPVLTAFRQLAGSEYDRACNGAVGATLSRIDAPGVQTVRLTENFVRCHGTVEVYPAIDPRLATRTTFVEWRGTEDSIPRAALFEALNTGFFEGALAMRLMAAPPENAFAQPCRVIVDVQNTGGDLTHVDQLRVGAGLQPAQGATREQLQRIDASSAYLRDEFFVRSEPNGLNRTVDVSCRGCRSWGADGLEFVLSKTAVQREASEPLLSPSIPLAVRQAAITLGNNTLITNRSVI